MDSIDEFVMRSAKRGRGWRIFSTLLLVGSVTFAVAYYLPLYRAHAALTGQFRHLSREATTQRGQLTQTLDTLKQVATERDQLSESSRKQQDASRTLATQLESLERELRTQLKKFIGPGKLDLQLQKDKIRFALASPALIANTGGSITEPGKSVICIIGAAAKSADLGVHVYAAAVQGAAKHGPEWQISALRAGNAAQHLVDKCGVESKQIELHVGPFESKADAALIIEIAPSP